MEYKYTVATVALILVLTLAPKDPSSGIAYLDKIGHLGIFFLFSTAALFDFRKVDNIEIKAVLAALLFGGVIELVQPCFGRSFELMDLAFDVIGALLGVLFIGKTRAILAKLQLFKTI